MDILCPSRIPVFFLITLVTSAGDVLNETRQHQPEQPVADFTISLPHSIDVCTLHVRISAGNSAGMSAPSEAVEVGKLQFTTTTIELKLQESLNQFVFYTLVCSGDNTEFTTTDSTTVTVSPTTASIGNRQQGDNTILIGGVLLK